MVWLKPKWDRCRRPKHRGDNFKWGLTVERELSVMGLQTHDFEGGSKWGFIKAEPLLEN